MANIRLKDFRKNNSMKLALHCVSFIFISIFYTQTCVATETDAHTDYDSIKRLNDAFRQAYAKTRDQVLQQSGPIILVQGHRLILINGDKRLEGSIVNNAYHDLKTVAHTPLAIYALLALQKNGSLSDTVASHLVELKKTITQVSREFVDRLDDAALETRQQILLESCIDFIDNVLVSKRYSHQKLLSLTKGSLPQIQENLEEASKYRIDNYHFQALEWRKMLGPDQWARMHVLIPGATMSRVNHLAVQYFAKLLGERGESRRIIYAESRFAESQALDLLGTHLFDTQIGIAFFSDPWRMHRDALGTSAARYLETMEFDTE